MIILGWILIVLGLICIVIGITTAVLVALQRLAHKDQKQLTALRHVHPL